MTDKCVHTEHCCTKHGCKYGDDNCPVVLGLKKQSYACEECCYEKEELEHIKAYANKLGYGLISTDMLHDLLDQYIGCGVPCGEWDEGYNAGFISAIDNVRKIIENKGE